MNLNYRQQHQLRRIEAGLRRADPHLGAMFGVFGRLYPHQDMPAWEQQPRVPSSQAPHPASRPLDLRGARRRGHGDRSPDQQGRHRRSPDR